MSRVTRLLSGLAAACALGGFVPHLAGCGDESPSVESDTTVDAGEEDGAQDAADTSAADTVDCSTPTYWCPCNPEDSTPCCYNDSVVLRCLPWATPMGGQWLYVEHATECEPPFALSFCPHWAHSVP